MNKNIVLSFLLTVLLIIAGSELQAQISLKKKLEDLKNKVNSKVENKIDRGVDNSLDTAESKIAGVFKGKGKGKDKKGNTGDADSMATASGPSVSSGTTSQSAASSSTGANGKSGDSLVNAFVTKFDFIPGEKILAVESFEKEQIGDFPNFWDTDASGEIVTFTGTEGKWLKLGNDGFFLPEFYKELPENFTMEFDIMVNDAYSWYSHALGIVISTSETTPSWKPDKRQRTSSGLLLNIHPVNASSTTGVAAVKTFLNGKEVLNSDQAQGALTTASGAKIKATKVHLSLWKQGQRIRIYLNEKKYWDLPKAFSNELKHNKLFLLTQSAKENEHFFVSNFKLAAGTPDTRSKLITEGSLTTNGITFNVNSDRLKEESYGVIKEIATILTENPTVRVKIIGHTDNDGAAALNHELSLKRATSVQSALVNSFNIDKSRLEVEGKGAAEPVAENNSALNKALNRRVQFVKL